MQRSETDTSSSVHIISALKAGDQQAFSVVYEQHVKALISYAFKCTRSLQQAEDIVHEVFVAFWQARDRIDPELPIKAYLFSLTKRRILNYIKRAATETRVLSEIMLRAAQTGASESDKELYAQGERLILEAMALLPEQRRKIFEFCRVKGFTYKQAAQHFNITEGTVNDHMVKALRQIRQQVGHKNPLIVLLLYWWW